MGKRIRPRYGQSESQRRRHRPRTPPRRNGRDSDDQTRPRTRAYGWTIRFTGYVYRSWHGDGNNYRKGLKVKTFERSNMTTVYIALGTNLGDRLANLRDAIDALAPNVTVLRESTIYETPPWGFTDQPAFLNMVVEAETSLHPCALLDYLKEREKSLGRVKNFRYGPRHIDLDILFYGAETYKDERLQIPHPRLHERAFVLVPLNDLAPDLVHPVLGKDVKSLLSVAEKDEIHPFSV
jgi:2-amino-4-hydroxy-6-hydroxymethyldihydropteridine diphosphokinase